MYRRVGRFCKKKAVTSAAKPPYVVFNPHAPMEGGKTPPLSSAFLTPLSPKWIQVAAIDPAVKNCAIRVERRTFENDQDQTKPTKCETILLKRIDFLTPPSDESSLATKSVSGSEYGCQYMYMIEYMAKYADYFASCHYILIESQMAINTEMMRMSQGIITAIAFIVRNRGLRPLIIEIDPKLKSSTFGAPRMDKPTLKRWTETKAIEILTENNETEIANYIREAKKADDLGDVVCYTTAWFKILNEGVFTPPHISSHE
jgi:hypothetical protein